MSEREGKESKSQKKEGKGVYKSRAGAHGFITERKRELGAIRSSRRKIVTSKKAQQKN